MTDRLSQLSSLIAPIVGGEARGVRRGGGVRIIGQIINLVAINQIVAVVVQPTPLAVGPA